MSRFVENGAVQYQRSSFRTQFQCHFHESAAVNALKTKGEVHSVLGHNGRPRMRKEKGVGDPQKRCLVAHPFFRIWLKPFSDLMRAKPPPYKLHTRVVHICIQTLSNSPYKVRSKLTNKDLKHAPTRKENRCRT